MRPWLLVLPYILFVVACTKANDTQSLIWGTWRPGLYFGLKPRIPKSLMTGLIWFGAQDYESFMHSRHTCNQDDGLDTYTWIAHDPREGGIQVLKDGKNNIEITTEWLKVPGGSHGGSWAARIKGVPIDPQRPSRTSFIPYFALEGLGSLELLNEENENGLEGTIRFSGSTPELGDYTIQIAEHIGNTPIIHGPHAKDFKKFLGKTSFLGFRAADGQAWQAKESIMPRIIEAAQTVATSYQANGQGLPDPAFVLRLPNEIYSGSNLYAMQKFFDGKFQFDISFDSGSVKQKVDSGLIDNGIPAFKEAFDRRFESVFPLPASTSPSKVKFSRDITASLLGGVGYFSGDSIINKAFTYEWDEADEIEETESTKLQKGVHYMESKELLTATPSRSFFPRGFYWDEGFHLLHIGAWDMGLSMEILKDWVNLIDENGWVAREQILGDEARSRVPAEFIAQHPTYANPPTLTMAVTAIISRMRTSLSQDPLPGNLGMQGPQIPLFAPSASQGPSIHQPSPDDVLDFLRSIYAPLKRHYDWFRRTQRGQIKEYSRVARSRTEAYRWRGRSPDHVLTSGMDDYPRGPPHEGELHLDLISWMGFFTQTMKDVANFLGIKEDEKSFAEIENAILQNIEGNLHWSEEEQMYCDADIDEDDESYHVCHKGYVSLFPFLLGLIPSDSPHLKPILDILHSPAHLWSPYGIRSLSLSHPLFGKGENYWRGPIWIQMNFLALRSLHKIYAVKPGPQQDRARTIYSELRDNIIKNVQQEYERTGYVWEQYDPLTGEGKRSHPFTGWTSLVTLILSEQY